MGGAGRHEKGVMTVGDGAGLTHPKSGGGVGYAIEPGRRAAAWAHEPHRRKDFSAATLSGYARQLLRHRGREHLSGQALVNLVPNMELLEPVFRAYAKDGAASRALVESFTGDAPVYSLLKHPRALARALKDVAGNRQRA